MIDQDISTNTSHKPLNFNKCVQNEHLKSNCPSLFSVTGQIIEPQNPTVTFMAHAFLFTSCEDPLLYSHGHQPWIETLYILPELQQ